MSGPVSVVTRVAAVVVLVAVVLVVLAWALQRRLIYLPTADASGATRDWGRYPGLASVP